MSENLDDFLEYAQETYERPLPRYVEREFRDYLDCGRFEAGFVRCHCDQCGHDLLVALSCKNRGTCPSCSSRRMANTAAHLADRVVPNVPVRQWVLSLPFELRRLAAFRADVLTACSRIFYETVAAHYVHVVAVPGAKTGAVTFVQRFGGSCNLHPHMHLAALDGALSFESGLSFIDARPPTKAELDAIVRQVETRIVAWLKRKGLVDARAHEDRSNAPAEATPLDACAELAPARGTFGSVPVPGDACNPADGTADDNDEAALARRAHRDGAEHNGFNLHAGVRIDRDDFDGRERLFRYGLRPCFALERLSELEDGRLAYRVKAPRSPNATHRIMSRVEFLARLAALVPPPRYPLVRYHGVLAPNSPVRKLVVPRPPPRAPRCPIAAQQSESAAVTHADQKAGTGSSPSASDCSGCAGCAANCAARVGASNARPRSEHDQNSGTTMLAGAAGGAYAQSHACAVSDTARPLAAVMPPSGDGLPAAGNAVIEQIAPNVLSVKHWGRLLNGALLATSPRVEWPILLRRTFGLDVLDVLDCPTCHGRLRIVAAITDRSIARKIFQHAARPDPGSIARPGPESVPPRARSPAKHSSKQATLPWGT